MATNPKKTRKYFNAHGPNVLSKTDELVDHVRVSSNHELIYYFHSYSNVLESVMRKILFNCDRERSGRKLLVFIKIYKIPKDM